MPDNIAVPCCVSNAAVSPYRKITIKRHKQLTELSYEVEAFMDKKLKKDFLKDNELCLFGRMMQDVLQIKMQEGIV